MGYVLIYQSNYGYKRVAAFLSREEAESERLRLDRIGQGKSKVLPLENYKDD